MAAVNPTNAFPACSFSAYFNEIGMLITASASAALASVVDLDTDRDAADRAGELRCVEHAAGRVMQLEVFTGRAPRRVGTAMRALDDCEGDASEEEDEDQERVNIHMDDDVVLDDVFDLDKNVMGMKDDNITLDVEEL